MARFNDINIPIEDRELTEGQFVSPPQIDSGRGNVRIPESIEGQNPIFRQINEPEQIPQQAAPAPQQVPQISDIDPEQPLSKLEELDSTEQYINTRYDRINSEYKEKLNRKKKLIAQGAKMGIDYSIVSDRLKQEGLDKLKVPKELKELEDFRQEILQDKDAEGRAEGRDISKEDRATDRTISKEGRVEGQADVATNEVASAMFGKAWSNLSPEEQTQVLAAQQAASPSGQKAALAKQKGQSTIDGTLATAQVITSKVDQALDTIDKEFGVTGFTGSQVGKVPGTDAYDLQKTIESIKSNLGFEELKAMKAASPTGGALGQVTVQEIEFLQNTVASLDIGQSKAVLQRNLKEIRTKYQTIINKIDKGNTSTIETRRGRVQELIDEGKSKQEILAIIREEGL